MINISVQVKSKQRVSDHGEVFTAEREVKAMCDLVADECTNIRSRFLEPACGEGNFLAEILSRKLQQVKQQYGDKPEDYALNSIIALCSLYGIDILSDNVRICREKLFWIWHSEYISVCSECPDDLRSTAEYILSVNIVCGDALELKFADDNQHTTDKDILFPEWIFSGSSVSRRDYSLYFMVNAPLLAQTPVNEYQPVNYRRIAANEPI